MTFKSAVAGLPLGGGKGVIMLPAGAPPLAPARRRDALLDFGDSVAQLGGRYVTAEDVGTSGRRHDGDRRADRPRRRAGAGARRLRRPEPVDGARRRDRRSASPPSASGARRTSCGRSVAVVGLGARRRHARPRRSPPPARRSSSPTSRPPSARSPTSWARPGSTPTPRCAPRSTSSPRARSAACSTTTRCPTLRCRAVAGAANNQLASDDVADDAAARGILWAPDFVANAGGIINIAVELEPDGYDPDRARERVLGDRRHAAHGLRRRAEADGRHPARRRAGARPPPARLDRATATPSSRFRGIREGPTEEEGRMRRSGQ